MENKEFNYDTDCNSLAAKMWKRAQKKYDACRRCKELSIDQGICVQSKQTCKDVNKCWKASMDKTMEIDECRICYEQSMPWIFRKKLFKKWNKKNDVNNEETS